MDVPPETEVAVLRWLLAEKEHQAAEVYGTLLLYDDVISEGVTLVEALRAQRAELTDEIAGLRQGLRQARKVNDAQHERIVALEAENERLRR